MNNNNIKKLVINIDMINGFLKKGALASPSIMRIVPIQKEILDEALESSDTGIVFVRDSHSKNATEFKNYPVHCIKNSKESELIDELKKYEKYANTYLKNSTNLIYAPNIMNDLKSLKNLEEVRLMGCLSEVCVKNGAIALKTYFDEINKDADVLVYADAIDTFDAPNHESNKVTLNALKEMENSGVKVLKRK